jgi:hypothetical protein
VLVALAGAVGLACSPGEIGGSADGVSRPDAAVAAAVVGPNPLRRLTANEYGNALHDLFPTLSPTLPALPPDVPVSGFDNAAEAQQPSDVLIARYEAVGNLYGQAATATVASTSAVVGCSDWSTAALATACATTFLTTTGARIFRRPLASDELSRYLVHFQAWLAAVDFEGAVQLTLSALLQSPQFLYRVEVDPPAAAAGTLVPVEPYGMASRLSFLLWESVPDDQLLLAASRNELATEAQVRTQVTRMLADDRARRVFWDFPREWLGLDRILLDEHAVRTPQVDPDWTVATQDSVYQETQTFVENVLVQGGTFRDLMTSPRAWVNGEMARIYGLPAPTDPTVWAEVSLPPAERSGLLTRASFLAGYSHRGATSPPVRGNGIQLRFLCQLPVSPPPGVDTSQPKAAPGQGPQTNRMLFEARTSPAACQACHAGLNGFGFGLENYDAAGHYQTTDNGLPVDASGVIRGTDVDGPFNGGIALAAALARSATVHDCATQEMVRYALGRAPSTGELPTVAALSKSFLASKGDLRALLTSIATSESFRMHVVGED